MIHAALVSAEAPAPAGAPRVSAAASAADDLFALGRAAATEARQRHEGRGVFGRSRQLLPSGAWRGPRDAADAYVEETDLAALGGLGAAMAAGVRTLVLASTPAGPRTEAAGAGNSSGLRRLVRIRFRASDSDSDRQSRLGEVLTLLRHGLAIDGIIPTPEGEPLGLDTLRMVAHCRRVLPVNHLLVDFTRLGHRLAQMCLGFGADELFGPIVAERALRLGDNANNPAMTRKEAAVLIRGAGLVPHERLTGGILEAFAP